jgi:NAD+ diphosphatase
MFVWPDANTSFVSGVTSPENIERAWYFLCSGQEVAHHFDEEGRWQPYTEEDSAVIEAVGGRKHFLGVMGDVACFTIEVENKSGIEFGNLRLLFGRADSMMTDLAGRAIQVCDWYRTHQFCGKCGTKTVEHSRDRAMICEHCRIHSYPRLSPSIIVLVHRDDEVLLVRNHRFPEGMYSTLAGFVEPGESIEQTLVREVKEEVGVDVRNLKYLGSQPWPFPNSLMLGFHAEYDSGQIVPQEEEIADARWFRCDNLPAIPGKMAISRWLIDDYLSQIGVPLSEQ